MNDNKKTIESALIDGIRKSINRFRERPLNYFTESDIHSSLMKDIFEGNSDIFLYRDPKSNLEVSLLHNEYPTNFRYKKMDLLSEYSKMGINEIIEKTKLTSDNSDRGNYDLAILNEAFVKKCFENPIRVDKHTDNNPVTDLSESVKHIINKDISYPYQRMQNNEEQFKKEVSYAIEVKFIHPFNARNKEMLDEVVKDNTKLQLAQLNSDNNLIPINLVFCSSDELNRTDKKDTIIRKVKDYIEKGKVESYNNGHYVRPDGVINVFIESYLKDDSKETSKPIIRPHTKNNEALINKLQ